MFISPAYAQDFGGYLNSSSLVSFLPLVLIFGVFYFLLIRPQQTQQRKLKELVAGVKRGDRVLTAGGIVGTVQRARPDSNEIEVEIAPNVRVTVLRDTLSSVMTPGAANDSKPAKSA